MRTIAGFLAVSGFTALSACVPTAPEQIVCWHETGHPAPQGVLVDPYGRRVATSALVTTPQYPGMVCMPIVSRRLQSQPEGDARLMPVDDNTLPPPPFGPIDHPYASEEPAVSTTAGRAGAVNDPDNDLQGSQVPSAVTPGTTNGAIEGDVSANNLADSIIGDVFGSLGMSHEP